MERRPLTDAASIVRLVALTSVQSSADTDALLAGLRDEARDVGEVLVGRSEHQLSEGALELLAALEGQRDAGKPAPGH